MKNYLTFHKGDLSEINKGSIARYTHDAKVYGNIQVIDNLNGVYSYSLCVETDSEACKLTTVASVLWEMRRHALQHKVRHIAIEKTSKLLGTLTWSDIKKCLDESFAKTNIKVIVFEP